MTAAASAIVASWRLLNPPEPTEVSSETRAPTDSDFTGTSVLPLLFGLYYNEVRTHLSLHKNAPTFRRPKKLGLIAVISMLGGLHHQYVRV